MIQSTSVQTIEQGSEKEIAQGAQAIIMRMAQKDIYSNPIGSFIRETVSNAKDSIFEKNAFRKIKNNEINVSDIYSDSSQALYKDSKFNPNYTLLENLSTNDEIKIEIEYNKYDSAGIIKITDYGIGCSFDRLIGMTNIGFSTKRLNNKQKGFFGAGAKVGLSYSFTDHYNITSVHDKKKFSIDCYMYDRVSVKPKLNSPSVDYKGKPFYYEEVKDKNHTTVSLRININDVDSFIQECKTQLLYFKNVRLFKNKVEIPFAAEILYEDEYCIISKTTEKSIFSAPQLVAINEVGKKHHDDPVCYGKINYGLMRDANKYGNIAIKVPIESIIIEDDGSVKLLQEGVEVVASRESVVYNEKTIKYIRKVTERLEKNLIEYYNKEVEKLAKTDDFIEWCKTITSIQNKDNNSVLGVIRNFVNFNNKTTLTFKDKYDYYGGNIYSKDNKEKDKMLLKCYDYTFQSVRLRGGKIEDRVVHREISFYDFIQRTGTKFIKDANHNNKVNKKILLSSSLSFIEVDDSFNLKLNFPSYQEYLDNLPIEQVEEDKPVKKERAKVDRTYVNHTLVTDVLKTVKILKNEKVKGYYINKNEKELVLAKFFHGYLSESIYRLETKPAEFYELGHMSNLYNDERVQKLAIALNYDLTQVIPNFDFSLLPDAFKDKVKFFRECHQSLINAKKHYSIWNNEVQDQLKSITIINKETLESDYKMLSLKLKEGASKVKLFNLSNLDPQDESHYLLFTKTVFPDVNN